MKAIAMKMTQEEFDSIKDLLDKKTINSVGNFNKYPYLSNYNGSHLSLNSINKYGFYYVWRLNPEVYENFDRDIFLKACDIEVDKVWKASELQYYIDGKWTDCRAKNLIYRLKPQPDYSKEIESLQDRAKENGMKATITFEKL